MEEHQFEALGTLWRVSIDTSKIASSIWQEVEAEVELFDQRFSRFILNSEANTWRTAKSGKYPVSPEFANLLDFAQTLRAKTHDKFDPAIGGLLELSGYNREYDFTPDISQIKKWRVPHWNLTGLTLDVDGPVVFDVGGYGKGSCVDLVVQLLQRKGFQYFLVDGGGDMYGSSKKDGSGWNVAVEWPGKPDEALTLVTLKNQALAASDILRRRWQEWHHLLDPLKRQPHQEVLSCATVSSRTQTADGLTTALALTPPENRATLASEYSVEYVMVTSDQKVHRSAGWPGQFWS